MSRSAASSTWRYGRRIAVATDLKFGWLGRARSPASRHSPRFCRQCLRGKCEEDHELGYELVERLVSGVLRRRTRARDPALPADTPPHVL
jgi:hypothetical protein